jgi:hypothetical protein
MKIVSGPVLILEHQRCFHSLTNLIHGNHVYNDIVQKSVNLKHHFVLTEMFRYKLANQISKQYRSIVNSVVTKENCHFKQFL